MVYYGLYKVNKNFEVRISDVPIKYSYARMPFNADDILQFANWLEERGISNFLTDLNKNKVYIIQNDTKDCNIILQTFNRRVSDAKKKGLFELTPNIKHLVSNIDGTSVLVRSSTKDKIKIARRTKYTTCNINVIFINDGDRERFFADTKIFHGIPDNREYKLVPGDGSAWIYWNDIMDREYARLCENQ